MSLTRPMERPPLVNSAARARRIQRPTLHGSLSGLIALAIILLPIAPGASADEPHLVIKMATTAADGSPLIRQMQRFAAILEQRTAGLTRVKLFPDGRLGDDAKLLADLEAGALQIYAGDFDALGNVAKEAQVLSAPFLFDDYANADKHMDGAARQRFEDALAQRNMAFCAWGPSVFTRWFGPLAPPRTPQAFDGLTVVDRGAGLTTGWELLNAHPLAGLDAAQGAKRWLLRSTSVRARVTGADAHATHVTRSDDVLHGYAIVLSRRWFDGLPARTQEVLERWPLDPTLEARREARELDDALLDRMEKRGKTLVTLSGADRRTFAPFGRKVAAQRAANAGPKGQALLNALR